MVALRWNGRRADASATAKLPAICIGVFCFIAATSIAAPAATSQDDDISIVTTLTPRAGVRPYGAMRVTRGAGPGRVVPPYVILPGSRVDVSATGGGGTVVFVTPPPAVPDRVVVQRSGPGLPAYTFTLTQPRSIGLPPAPTGLTLTRVTTIGGTVITETRNVPRYPFRCRAPEIAFTLDWGPFTYRWWSYGSMYRRGWSVSGGSLNYLSTRAGFWAW